MADGKAHDATAGADDSDGKGRRQTPTPTGTSSRAIKGVGSRHHHQQTPSLMDVMFSSSRTEQSVRRAATTRQTTSTRLNQNNNPLVNDEDVLLHLMPFAEAEGYQFVGGVSKCWRDAWDGGHGGNSGLKRESTLASAVESASRLAWAKAGGCRWDGTICQRAAAGGHLDTLRFARSRGCPWDERTCTQAAASGQLSILRWAHANGCPWDAQTCATAAWGGDLDMLRYVSCDQKSPQSFRHVLQADTINCRWYPLF